jgi:hypothetical protein
MNKKRKFGEEPSFKEEEIILSNSRSDMRGHTGFLLVSYLY